MRETFVHQHCRAKKHWTRCPTQRVEFGMFALWEAEVPVYKVVSHLAVCGLTKEKPSSARKNCLLQAANGARHVCVSTISTVLRLLLLTSFEKTVRGIQPTQWSWDDAAVQEKFGRTGRCKLFRCEQKEYQNALTETTWPSSYLAEQCQKSNR